MRPFVTRFVCGLAVCLLIPGLALAQEGIISGTVSGTDTGDPLPGATVRVLESDVGTAADVEGNFTISGVNPGVKTVRISFVGYQTVTEEVTVEAGETSTLDVTLEPTARRIGEVVVTGVGHETPQANLSFNVDQVNSEALQQVTASNPMESLQGKMSGVHITPKSGEPGSGLDVTLRAATTLTGDNSPLFIVDGVILGADQVDIGALDIQNIEVVKGAAASSLYGSRAQNGVINITTKRGQEGSLGETRVTFRSEVGVQNLHTKLNSNQSHGFATNDQNVLLSSAGNPTTYGSDLMLDHSGPNGTRFFDNRYSDLRKPSGEPYNVGNPFDRFFDPGNTYTNYLAISQNSEQTNFRISYEDGREGGVVAPPRGDRRKYNRKRFRLNLDHRPSEDLTVSASGFYADIISNRIETTDFNPFFDLMFTNPLSDLRGRDEQGELIIKPDPRIVEANPLYHVENAEVDNNRSRFLGNLRGEYSPYDWFTLESNLSYDRLDRREEEFYKRGYKTRDPSIRNRGEMEEQRITDEALNYSFTGSFVETFDELTARGQLKYQAENQEFQSVFVQGNDFAAVGIRNFENIADQESKDVSSSRRTIKSESFYATTSGDYDNRYILDLLIRRDGSSLFGPEERWQTYYRGSGGYRIAQEDFWPAPDAINQFKLRYSFGTAGARPNFSAQYETYQVNEGELSKSTLGNAELKPEFQQEQEFGLDVGFYDRLFLTVNYVDTKVEDQLLQVPLSGPLGFESQWQNAGTLETTTWEANLDATLLRTRDFAWNAGLTFDRTTQEITEFNTNPYRTGPANLFYYRDGEVLGAMYGAKLVTERSELQTMGLDPSNFERNDDGYMVPVGDASWRDGFNDSACPDEGCWGTTVSTAQGDLQWGLPIQFVDEEGDDFHRIGSTVPDFNLNFSTNLSYQGFTAYALLSYQDGGDVYNQTKQWSYRDRRHADQDDGGVAQHKKKPEIYYAELYNKNADISHFVEDATYLKIREVSLGYRFDESQLNNLIGASNPLRQISINLTGRNLFTFTDYSGFDPEIGSGGGGENANVFRVDNFQYPPFRTITGRVELQF